jgi:hypothetical protein
MNMEDFESKYRDAIDEILNQLQTLTLVVARAETKISEIGNSVQKLSLTVEEFITVNRSQEIQPNQAEVSESDWPILPESPDSER